MISNISTIDELIKKQNPFAGHLVVKPQQIWGKSFPDVSSINAHASNAVFDAVEKIYQRQRTTVGITIVGEKGLGKSHIISRIRHCLQTEDNSLFIYMSKYDNLNQIKYELLQSVASSLRAFSTQKVMQWQEIAAALINEAKQWNHIPQKYISNQISLKVVEQLLLKIQQIKPELTNPYILKAILWTLSPEYVNYANLWLSGWEITQAQADAMGLPNFKKEDRETEALHHVRQILDITSHYKVPVLCFDELDNADVAENGLTTAQVIASLVKDLYNNLRSGVLLLAMYTETWNDQIRFLPQSEAVIDRLVSEKADRQPIELKYLNPDNLVAIVQKWLQDFYQENQQTPPYPLYPFNEAKLQELGKSRPTVRAILNWCADNFVPPDIKIPPSPPSHLVESYFDSELVNIEASINSLMEDESTIADALWLAFKGLIGETVEGVTIKDIEEIGASAGDDRFIDFVIVSKDEKVRIGVSVIQQDGKFIGAALDRLNNYQKFDLTRGCLVRSKKINPGAKLARERLRILLQENGGEWVGLQSKDIKPLLAIYFVWCNSESYELTEEQIFEFIEQKQLAINNPLIREILSDPSGQEPDNLTDDELPMRIPQSVASTDYVELKL